jgi:RecB family endonuclease NucS
LARKAKQTLKKHLQQYLSKALDGLEPGLKPLNNEELEFLILAGKIDLLATDKNRAIVVVKIVDENADQGHMDQIIKSMALIENELGEKNIRGLIVAEKFDQESIQAAEKVSNVFLIRYKIHYDFERAGGPV